MAAGKLTLKNPQGGNEVSKDEKGEKKGEPVVQTPPVTPQAPPSPEKEVRAAEMAAAAANQEQAHAAEPSSVQTPPAEKKPFSDPCELLSERGGCRALQGCEHKDRSCEAKRPLEAESPEVQARARAAVVPLHLMSGTPGQKIIIGNPHAMAGRRDAPTPQTGNLAKTNHVVSDPNAVKKGN